MTLHEMTYPVLQLTGDFAHVEIRKGSGPASWDALTPLYSGEGSKRPAMAWARGGDAGRALLPDAR